MEGTARKRWHEEETVLALYLYFQLPFGKLHSGNPEILSQLSSTGTTSTASWITATPDVSGGARTGITRAGSRNLFQYSLANMIVSTRRVTAGSAGPSLPNRNSRS